MRKDTFALRLHNKLMVILCCISLSCIFPLSAVAKDISGIVLSEADSTAIIGAACNIKVSDNYVEGVTTDAAGKFSLSTDIKNPVLLEIVASGYSPTEILLPEGSKNINVGKIFLSESEMLREIVVEGSHATDSRGRTIVYPSSSEVKSSSAVNLFQKLPLSGLDANPITRTITVDGGTPMIIINGVPSSMSDLNALSPEDISKVEFSRQTPARYADRGTSGLISITLKVRKDGGNVYLWGRSAFNCGFMDANARASYHQGPSEFILTYTPSWRNYHNVYDVQRSSYIADDFRIDLKTTDRNPFNYFSSPLNIKYNYAPTLRTLLSATFTLNSMDTRRKVFGFTEDSYLGDYDWFTRYKSNSLTPSVDIFLHHEFDSDNVLEAQIVGTFVGTEFRRYNDYYLPDGDESYITDIDSRRHSLISEVSYTHTFNRATELSVGFQNTLSRSTNTYLYSDYKPVLTENNNYLYTEIGHQFYNVYLSASTGIKMFWTKNDINERTYIRNLTMLQASYKINNRWSMQGTFYYSPVIPSLSQLTDYPMQSIPYLVSNGNPDLKVAEMFTYQWMTSFRHKKFNVSLLPAYRHTTNDPISDIFYLGDKKFLSQTVNAGSMRQFSPTLNLQMSGIAGLGVSLRFGLRYYHYEGENWSHDLTSFEAMGSIWWTRDAWTVSYYGRIPAKYLSGHIVGKGENGNTLALSWRPNKHWTLEASWLNCFDKKGFKYPSENISDINPGKYDRWIDENGNMLTISVAYSADFGTLFRSAKRNLNNSDRGTALPDY